MSIPHSKIRSALRRIWQWSPERREALRRARIAPGIYLCEICGKGHRTVDVDHKGDGVGRTPGARGSTEADTWSNFIQRLFVGPEGLRILCRGCHKERTAKARGKAATG